MAKKQKKNTLNPQSNNDDMFCKYAVTAALNHEKNGKNLQKMSKNHSYCNVKIPQARNKVRKFIQEEKSRKSSFVISAATEMLQEQIRTWDNAHIFPTK